MKKLPTWFWIVAIVGLVWNLMGVMAFYMDTTMTEDALAALTPKEQEFRSGFPMWTKIVYAIAVFGGTIGCIGLLLRAQWSRTVFGVSLIAILLQFGFSIGKMAKHEMLTVNSCIMPAVVILGGILLLLHSNSSTAKGWLK